MVLSGGPVAPAPGKGDSRGKGIFLGRKVKKKKKEIIVFPRGSRFQCNFW